MAQCFFSRASSVTPKQRRPFRRRRGLGIPYVRKPPHGVFAFLFWVLGFRVEGLGLRV